MSDFLQAMVGMVIGVVIAIVIVETWDWIKYS